MDDRSDFPQARLSDALAAAGVPGEEVADVRGLGGGTFNTVLRVRRTDGTQLVVKLAPDASEPVLRYEHRILATEAWFYDTVRKATGVPVPAVLTPPGDKGTAAGDHLVMSECPGGNWYELGDALEPGDRRRLRTELGRFTAALHSITGEGFGYPAEPLGPLRGSWREAFLEMVGAVLADAGRFAVELPEDADRIRELFAAQSAVLDEVSTPRLVHFDLWDGNILVDRGPAGARIGALIDAERAFWGDPLAEFVSLSLFDDMERDDAFLEGYRTAGGTVTFDASARRRLTLYRSYLYLIMWVEAVPRRFDAERCAWLRRQVVQPLAATFDSWAAQGRKGPA